MRRRPDRWSRQDGNERRLRDQALQQLAAHSELPPGLELRSDGTAGELHGWFSSLTVTDRAAAADEFLEQYRKTLRFPDGVGQLSEPELLREEQGAVRVLRRFSDGGIVYYRCGVEATFDEAGVLRTFRWRLPRDRQPSVRGFVDAPAATSFLREATGFESLPEPSLQVLDSNAIFGSALDSTPVWVFSSRDGNRPVDVIVSHDATSVLHVIPAQVVHTLAPIPQYHLDPTTGVPDFITFGPGGLLLPAAGSGSAVTVARSFFTSYPKLFGTGDVPGQLHVRDVTVDPAGMSHVVFQQVHGSIPVWGCELRVHLRPSLAVGSVSGRYLRDPEVALRVTVDEHRGRQLAIASYQANHPEELDRAPRLRPVRTSPAGLVILPLSLSRFRERRNHLTWRFQFDDADRFVSVATGDVVFAAERSWMAQQIFDGQGDLSLERGLDEAILQIRDGVDQVPPGSVHPEARAADAAGAAVEAFWRMFSWDGSDGHGADVNIYVGIGSALTTGTRWRQSRRCVVVPRDWAQDDIIGHELTHAVIHASAQLESEGESDAIAEHLSDVFANLIFPRAAGRWRFGDTVPGLPAPGFIRDLLDPTSGLEAGVSHYASYMTPTQKNRFTHQNGGIGNRAAVLLCDGDGSREHGGIGRDRLAPLYWCVLTTRLHPWSAYIDELHAIWETARDLSRVGFSLAGRAFDETVVREIPWAFRQVGLDLRLVSGWFEVPGNRTTDLVFNPGQTLSPSELVQDVDVVVQRRKHDDPDAGERIFRMVARATEGGTATDPSGTVSVAITSHGIGTTSKQVTARITSTSYLPTEAAARLSTQGVAPEATAFYSTTLVHWLDSAMFLGRDYDDVLNPGMRVLGAGCIITDIVLELLDEHYRVQSRHRMGEPAALYGGTGAYITTQILNSTFAEVYVRSWHDFGWAVRFRILYIITGSNCSMG